MNLNDFRPLCTVKRVEENTWKTTYRVSYTIETEFSVSRIYKEADYARLREDAEERAVRELYWRLFGQFKRDVLREFIKLEQDMLLDSKGEEIKLVSMSRYIAMFDAFSAAKTRLGLLS